MDKENYEKQIKDLINMFENKDADGIDRFLFRYEDKGMGMLFIALYHALKDGPGDSKEVSQRDSGGGE